MPTTPIKPKKDEGLDIGWVTVTYRSVFLSVFALVAAVGMGFYFAFPDTSAKIMNSTGDLFGSLANKLGITSPPVKPKGGRVAGDQKATFTMIDGTVKVRKRNGNTFISADYNTPLEKGDVIQTASEGMAKVVFADMTSYTVKPDSLIVIEDNSMNEQQQTRVAVQVTTGTVDLSTGTFSQGSKSQVLVAGATASLTPESVAEVRNDPRNDSHEILVKKGGGEVNRNGEVVNLATYEKVSFKSDSTSMSKTKEVGPPTLIDPGNMMPVYSTGASSSVKFSWTPVDGIKSFRIRISRNPYFTQLVMDKKTPGTDFTLAGLEEGAYYWSVQSLDDKGKESVESERNRFTIVPRSTDGELKLLIEPFVQHGRIIEVRGQTEPSARVMVNGGEVPLVDSNGYFRYLTPPLPNGENVITITAQNARGGVNSQTRKIVIQ